MPAFKDHVIQIIITLRGGSCSYQFIFTMQLTGGFRPQLFLESPEVNRNVTCRSDCNAVIYNPLHSHRPCSSQSDYSVPAEAVEKPEAQTYTRTAALLNGDSPTAHRKPSEKLSTALLNWKDRLRLRCHVGAPSLTLHAVLASGCLWGYDESPSTGTTGWEPHKWLSQSCPNPLHPQDNTAQAKPLHTQTARCPTTDSMSPPRSQVPPCTSAWGPQRAWHPG